MKKVVKTMQKNSFSILYFCYRKRFLIHSWFKFKTTMRILCANTTVEDDDDDIVNWITLNGWKGERNKSKKKNV